MPRVSREFVLLVVLLLVCSCTTPEQSSKLVQQRYEAAKQLFVETAKDFHLPSAQVSGVEKEKLLDRAADGYQQLLHKYADQPHWCAQALRSLANVRAEQGRLAAAVKLYSQVAEKYPTEEWEVLQAWKSAADQLWEAKRAAEAAVFYQKIVDRFGEVVSPSIIVTVVRGSQARLTELQQHP